MFYHPNFKKDREDLLSLIKRKPVQSTLGSSSSAQDKNNNTSDEYESERGKQETPQVEKKRRRQTNRKQEEAIGEEAEEEEEEQDNSSRAELDRELAKMHKMQKEMAMALQILTRNYEAATLEIIQLRKKISEQDVLIGKMCDLLQDHGNLDYYI